MRKIDEQISDPLDQSAFGFMGRVPISNSGYRVGVLGATGLVGKTVVKVLAERKFPIRELRLFASPRSEGATIETPFGQQVVECLHVGKPPELDVAFMAAGAESAKRWGWRLARRGAIVIDKSSYFRGKAYAPLVVPEVNPDALHQHRNIIATPNCTTIPLVMALKPLHDVYELRWVTVVSLQSVSGAGKEGVITLESELKDEYARPSGFSRRIAYNAIPWIGDGKGAHSGEEIKIIREARRILNLPRLPIRTTSVRIPTLIGHALAVHIEFQRSFDIGRVRGILETAPGIVVDDDPEAGEYPTPLDAVGRDEVFVGRIRRDRGRRGLALWIVADNLRKGAATNAIQIAERLLPPDTAGDTA